MIKNHIACERYLDWTLVKFPPIYGLHLIQGGMTQSEAGGEKGTRQQDVTEGMVGWHGTSHGGSVGGMKGFVRMAWPGLSEYEYNSTKILDISYYQ